MPTPSRTASSRPNLDYLVGSRGQRLPDAGRELRGAAGVGRLPRREHRLPADSRRGRCHATMPLSSPSRVRHGECRARACWPSLPSPLPRWFLPAPSRPRAAGAHRLARRGHATWARGTKSPNIRTASSASAPATPRRSTPRGLMGGLMSWNRCRKADGTSDDATGVARPVGRPARRSWRCDIAPAWLLLPAVRVWGGYWVIDLDPGYTLAAVSEPSREYRWILSRTPTVEGRRLSGAAAPAGDEGLRRHPASGHAAGLTPIHPYS